MSFIRGIHLHASLSGEYARSLMKNPLSGAGSYADRQYAVIPHLFNIDTHKPFRSERVNEIIERVRPEYLVLEQMSADRDEHERNLREQLQYLR